MKSKLAAAAACGLFLLSGIANAAEIKVLASGAVKEAATELFPQFEKASGQQGRGHLGRHRRHQEEDRGRRGLRSRHRCKPGARRLHQGRQVRGRQQGRPGAVVGRRRGEARRAEARLNSGDDLKKALLAAKSVGYSTGPSGVYIQTPVREDGHRRSDQGQGQGDRARRAGRVPDQGRRAPRSASSRSAN